MLLGMMVSTSTLSGFLRLLRGSLTFTILDRIAVMEAILIWKYPKAEIVQAGVSFLFGEIGGACWSIQRYGLG